MPKRILILTAGFGEGHNSAARGLRDGFGAVAPNDAAVELHDLFAETYGLANDLACRLYLGVINRAPQAWARFYGWLDRREKFAPGMIWLFLAKSRLRRLLKRFRPDIVIAVYPAYAHLLAEMVGSGVPPFRLVVCITDSITVNAIWYRCAADVFLVPNEQTAAVLASAGVPNEKVRVTGFPVTPQFAALGELRQPPSPQYGNRILYMINAGRVVVPEIIDGLAKIPQSRLTVTVGRDQNLRLAVEAVRKKAGRKFEILGWSDQLPRLMLESHLLISKAGGATVQEAIAACCPMIVNQIVPGQEEGNARLIQETQSGLVATTPATIIAAVERAFADDARQWHEWSVNIRRLSRPDASLEIARELLAVGA
jgi:processive 1,2-diacylglycerol beta-glucosyltransferase